MKFQVTLYKGVTDEEKWLNLMRVRLQIRRLWVQPPLGWRHSFVEIDHEIFPAVILSPADSIRAVVSFWQKNVLNTG